MTTSFNGAELKEVMQRLSFWDEHDAPAQGKRFYEYLTIANTFKDLLA